ncbi:hypothetical protein FE257_009287 [Aspergillus nanangensis]|uniref:Mis12-Mtw1 family protein n=1 Tax=Aspergillus nanangensis TaxID=2582783 RepID=A0AAD4CKJ9_ASPNN|nr:hypothetical protein FE257_009287 [Aspergillus nanangensis]
MTVTVLTTPRTKTKRREPLKLMNMGTSQTQARPASSAASGGAGRKGTRSSTRLSLNSQEKNDENSRSKRKGTFDEDVEGFQFSFGKSKKSKPSVEPVPGLLQPVAEEAVPKPSPRRGRPPKKRPEEKVEDGPVLKKKSAESTAKKQTRMAVEPEPQSTTESRSSRKRDQPESIPTETKRRKGRPRTSNGGEKQRNGYLSPEPQQQSTTATITLPMADTPVIQRNKEMRGAKSAKGNRRSSLGMRGRRASSLIDSGVSNALPHKEVNTADFYKHITSDGLPEPRRMRQLLIWCATRAMGGKPSGSRSEDESARLAARVIQEELLKDFSTNSELSNWFAREDVGPPSVVVKKPNPKNIQNGDKIKELEEQIQKLQKERQALNALLRPPSISPIQPKKQRNITPNGQPDTTLPGSNTKQTTKSQPLIPESIDSSLLEPSQLKLYNMINPETSRQSTNPEAQVGSSSTNANTLAAVTPSTVSSRLSHITSGLAPTLDSFAAGIHDIELYRAMSDAVSSRVLRVCAERLDERDANHAMHQLALEGDAGQSKELSFRQRPTEDLGLILGALSRIERR